MVNIARSSKQQGKMPVGNATPKLLASGSQAEIDPRQPAVSPTSSVQSGALSSSTRSRASTAWFPYNEAPVGLTEAHTQSNIPDGAHGYDILRRCACYIEEMSEDDKNMYWLRVEHDIVPRLSASQWSMYYHHVVLPKYNSCIKQTYGGQRGINSGSLLHQNGSDCANKLAMTAGNSSKTPKEVYNLAVSRLLSAEDQVTHASSIRSLQKAGNSHNSSRDEATSLAESGYTNLSLNPRGRGHGARIDPQVGPSNHKKAVIPGANSHSSAVYSGGRKASIKAHDGNSTGSRKQEKSSSKASTAGNSTIKDKTPAKKTRKRPPLPIRRAQKLAEEAERAALLAGIPTDPVKPDAKAIGSTEPAAGPPKSVGRSIELPSLMDQAMVPSKSVEPGPGLHECLTSPRWTVMIENIPTAITDTELMDKVRDAEISSVHLVRSADMRTIPRSTTNSARITFSHGDEMRVFCDAHARDPITFPDGQGGVSTARLTIVGAGLTRGKQSSKSHNGASREEDNGQRNGKNNPRSSGTMTGKDSQPGVDKRWKGKKPLLARQSRPLPDPCPSSPAAGDIEDTTDADLIDL